MKTLPSKRDWQVMVLSVDATIMAAMNGKESGALLALLTQTKASWSKTSNRLSDGEDIFSILESSLNGAQHAIDETQVFEKLVSDAEATLLDWNAEGINFLSIFDPDYPLQLHLIHQRPPFITYRGQLKKDDRRGIAIVGTRKATDQGKRQAFEIARSLARLGIPVISGLASGIDTAAHCGALEEGGRTVAVIGTGLRNYYPKENAALQNQIAEQSAVVSQFFPDMGPHKANFPMRNAIMSGYSAATLVVEASETSGAKMQARIALEHGRPVILLDTLLREHDWAREFAKRPNVTVVSSTSEACDFASSTSNSYGNGPLVENVA